MKKAIAIVMVFAMLALVAAVPAKAETDMDTSKDSVDSATIAIVTLPYKAEGLVRMKNGLMGVEKLKDIANFTPAEFTTYSEENTIVALVYTPDGKLPEQVKEKIRNFIESKLSEIWDRLNSGEMVVYTSEDDSMLNDSMLVVAPSGVKIARERFRPAT